MNAEWVVVINVTSVHSWHYNNSNSCSDLSWPRLFVYNMDNCHLPSPKLTSTLPCVGGWKTTYILSAFRWWDVTYSVARQWNTIYWRFPNSDLRFVRGFPLAQDGAERGKCASTWLVLEGRESTTQAPGAVEAWHQMLQNHGAASQTTLPKCNLTSLKKGN